MKLNDEQLLAVRHQLGQPAALVAGAGSGKTATLIARISYLTQTLEVVPRRILALTFTNKAAGEIQNRLPTFDEHNTPKICTIHSLALAAIRRAPKGFGLQEKVTPLDDYDQSTLLKQLIEKRKLEEQVNPYLLLEKIGYHRARGVGFTPDYTDEVNRTASITHGGYHQILDQELQIWKDYEQEKLKLSLIDFDDMLHLVVKRGREDTRWLQGLQRVFDCLLMDEAQDSNRVQWDYVNMILPPGNYNLMAIGDLNQSIYGWNGAEPRILLDFTKSWRGQTPAVYKLCRNHRSVPEIVTLANRSQAQMTDTVPLQMISYRGEMNQHGNVFLKKGLDAKELAKSVCYEISVAQDYENTAILIRAGSQVRDIETELVKYRIPYIVRGALGLLQTEEVKDILSYLKIAVNPRDYSAFCRSANLPKRGIGEASLRKAWETAQDFDSNIIQALDESGHRKLYGYVQLVKAIQERASTPDIAIDYLLRSIQYETYLGKKYKKYPDKLQLKLQNIERLKELILALMEERQLSIEDVVFQLTMQDQKDSAEGKVVVSTIHGSKGLEYKTVYFMNLYEGSLPHKWSQSDEEIAEERRLFYVGCTRAKDTLVLTVPGMVSYFNKEPQFVTPSRFLLELGIMK